jgi:23S rRNA pseudouridine1911/1915/1917 synthase
MTEDEPIIHYEDDSLIIIIKPPNLSSYIGKAPSIGEWLITNRPECATASLKKEEAALCHRLDHETSGLIIAAKTRAAYLNIREQFKNQTIEKYYLCLVEGKLTHEGLLESYTFNRYRGSKKVSVISLENKQPARSTKSSLVIKSTKYFPKEDLTLANIKLITGTRHQIRAQLASTKNPLVGDKLYGSTRKIEENLKDLIEVTLPFDLNKYTFLLHAYRIILQHPDDKSKIDAHIP